jgi:diguanylate cyclase
MTLTMIPNTDDLTGVDSATSFREKLDAAVEKEEIVSLALIDLDNFKGLNDAHGHKAGDELLRAVGRSLLELTEDTRGFAGRLGGDEFAIALPGVTLENAFLRLERFRSELIATAGIVPSVPAYRVSLSVGLASYPRDVQSVGAMLSRADEALWVAKQSGRNSVALPPSEDMVLKSSHYTRAQVGRLKALAEKQGAKESTLLREALDDLLRKYDVR